MKMMFGNGTPSGAWRWMEGFEDEGWDRKEKRRKEKEKREYISKKGNGMEGKDGFFFFFIWSGVRVKEKK